MTEERTPQKDDLSPESFLAFLNLLVEGWEREYKFYPGRRCPFDYANPRHLTRAQYGQANNRAIQETDAQSRIVTVFRQSLSVGAIAIEIQGGIFTKGGHTRGAGYKNDMKKYNAAQRRGWTLFLYTPPPEIYISKRTGEETLSSVMKREAWLKAVKRDIRVLLSGVEDGQRTLEDTCSCQSKLLSEKVGWSMTETSIKI